MGQTERVLSVDSKNAISEALNQSIAELVITTMMAQNFHWNVTGMAFGPLHELFQKIYEDHFEAQDELAERIKAIGGHANGMLGKMVADSKVLESDGKIGDREMIKTLAEAETTFGEDTRIWQWRVQLGTTSCLIIPKRRPENVF